MQFTKKEIKKKVSRFGKPLNLDKFIWKGKSNLFISKEPNLVLDFKYIEKVKLNISYASTVFAGNFADINACGGLNAVVGGYSNVICRDWSNITIDCFSNAWVGSGTVIKVMGSGVKIFFRGREIETKTGDVVETCPGNIKGYLLNGELNGAPHIIAHNILSRILSKKGNIYNVVNHGEHWDSWLIKHKDTYAHGETLENARSCLMKNILAIDHPKHHDLTLKSIMAVEDSMRQYHSIKGACRENKNINTNLISAIKKSLKGFFN